MDRASVSCCVLLSSAGTVRWTTSESICKRASQLALRSFSCCRFFADSRIFVSSSAMSVMRACSSNVKSSPTPLRKRPCSYRQIPLMHNTIGGVRFCLNRPVYVCYNLRS